MLWVDPGQQLSTHTASHLLLMLPVGLRETRMKLTRLVDQDKGNLIGEEKVCVQAKQRRNLFTTPHQQTDV